VLPLSNRINHSEVYAHPGFFTIALEDGHAEDSTYSVFSVLPNLLLHFADGEKPETKQKRLEVKYAALQIVPNIEKLGAPKVSFLITL
jgi:hypothetical protein